MSIYVILTLSRCLQITKYTEDFKGSSRILTKTLNLLKKHWLHCFSRVCQLCNINRGLVGNDAVWESEHEVSIYSEVCKKTAHSLVSSGMEASLKKKPGEPLMPAWTTACHHRAECPVRHVGTRLVYTAEGPTTGFPNRYRPSHHFPDCETQMSKND